MSEAPAWWPDDRPAQFGRLLGEALGRRDLTQQGFGRMVGASQASVSGWIAGRYEPSPTKVFAMEVLLSLEPGTLCRALGYRPVDTAQTPSVEVAIAESTGLDDEDKAALLGAYRALSRSREPGRRPDGIDVGPRARAGDDSSGRSHRRVPGINGG